MEYINKIKNFKIEDKESYRLILNTLFIIILLIVCVAMILGIVTLIKNKDIIQKDPITYVMNNMDFKECHCIINIELIAECTCLDMEGLYWETQGSRFARTYSFYEEFNKFKI